jgi:uncharacterized membrane protein (UPF0127 family)
MATSFEHISISAARLHARTATAQFATCSSVAESGARFASVHVARTFISRFIGLLGRKALADNEGVLFVPGGSIHTLGMRFAIDVVFLDVRMSVLKVVADVRPWRFACAPRGTHYVLELGAGRAAAAQLKSGEPVFVHLIRPERLGVALWRLRN